MPAILLAPGASTLPAQTVIAQYAVTADTTLDAALTATGGTVADGTTYKPVIAGTTALHRDALYVSGGATLTLASGADVAVKNEENLTTFLRIGYGDGQTGTLAIASGANLAVGQASRYANFQVAEGQGATGTVQQSGGTVTVKGSFNVGVNGGNGTYNLSGGAFTLDHDDAAANHTSLAVIGFNNLGSGSGGSTGTLNLSGGTLTVTAHEWDPAGHPGQYGSVSLILGNRDTGAASYGAGNGTLNQTGGILHVDNQANLFLSSVGNGTYNLSGGTLEIGGSSLKARYGNGPGTYAFNYGAGTIKVTGSALTTAVNFTLQRTDGGTASGFDTNGYDATLSGNITTTATGQVGTGGNGWFKLGAGTLNFTGTSRAFNTFGVMGGTVAQGTGATTATEFMVGTGRGYTGAYLMNGGSITISQTLNDGGATTVGSMRTGDYGGTGTFTQNAGTVTINDGAAFHVGNQGGTGTYNLAGGTLTLIGNINVLGRSDPNKAASTGTLNVSGGLLQLQGASARLILGNNFSSAATSTGTLNQTGGTVSIANESYLYLAGYGNGAYNLNGGTLEIGGGSLIARYNNTASTYALNLGGGTLKVAGSNLTTSVDAALTSNAQSILDTNGLDATWSGNFTGNGGLSKSGTGTLTLSGASRTFGFFNAAQGATVQSAGTTTSPEFVIGSGTGANGAFTLSGGSIVIDSLPPFGGSSSGLRVGDFGGTGTFTQTAGAVTVGSATVGGSWNIGNQGGTGTYNLAGGTLTLGYGLHNLGRNVTGSTASSGTLNLSGGTLEITGGSKLILGDRDPAGLSGTGTITQTGGTLRVTSGGLYLSAYGNGTYNLNGGTLEVGGSNLIARYAGSGTSALNLGGGTVKVIGTDLNSSLAATLAAGTTSTLNTNSLNATWSGLLSGDGGLAKTGAGTLNLSNSANAYTGATTVSAGTLNLTGKLLNSAITVANGATLTGGGTASGLTVASGGTFSPGAGPGTFTLNGPLTLASGSFTNLQLGGLARGTGYDAILAQGTISFGGTLTVSYASGFQPTLGNSFDLFDGGSTSGSFSAVNLPALGNGLTWNQSQLYASGVLSVVAIPEPAVTVASAGLAGLALAAWRRRRLLASRQSPKPSATALKTAF